MTSPRLALAAAALPLLAACNAILPIDLAREVPLVAPAGPFSKVEAIDLTTESGLWSYREKVDAVSLDEVSATVLSVAAGHQAGSVDLTLSFRPEGAPADGSADLRVGTLRDLPLVPGGAAAIQGSAALDQFLLDVLRGSGGFSAVATGSLDGAADAVLEIRLVGSVTYALASF